MPNMSTPTPDGYAGPVPVAVAVAFCPVHQVNEQFVFWPNEEKVEVESHQLPDGWVRTEWNDKLDHFAYQVPDGTFTVENLTVDGEAPMTVAMVPEEQLRERAAARFN